MTSQKAYDEPTKVTVVEGEVALDGPDGIGLSMTPEAALETGKRLQESAQKAQQANPPSTPPEPTK